MKRYWFKVLGGLILIFFVILLLAIAYLLAGNGGSSSQNPQRGATYSIFSISGIEAKSPVLSTLGIYAMAFGQNSGITMYNVQLACSEAATGNVNTGMPNPPSAYEWLGTGQMNGKPATGISNSTSTLASGQTINVTGLVCYGANAQPLGSIQPVTGFSGSIWLNYTDSAGSVSQSNPWQSERIISVNINAT